MNGTKKTYRRGGGLCRCVQMTGSLGETAAKTITKWIKEATLQSSHPNASLQTWERGGGDVHHLYPSTLRRFSLCMYLLLSVVKISHCCAPSTLSPLPFALYPGEHGWYLCQMAGSFVGNSKLGRRGRRHYCKEREAINWRLQNTSYQSVAQPGTTQATLFF